jgi:glycosyltransferase involved in cell wall biosynthesis
VIAVTEPAVSLVIPVFNGEDILAVSLERVSAFLDHSDLNAEIIVVDDGSTDATPEIMRELTDSRTLGISLPRNQGKFAAVKAGMAAARGHCRIFTDADIPYDLEAVPYMADLLANGGFHIVVGDRTLAESRVEAGQPRLRRISTRVFSFSVRMLVTGELFDTQVGFKAFRSDVASALFPIIADDGFAGDVELLYVALKYNLAIRRIPVRLQRSGPTTVSLAGHSLPMLRRIAGLKRRWARGLYVSDELSAIADQRYWATDDDA